MKGRNPDAIEVAYKAPTAIPVGHLGSERRYFSGTPTQLDDIGAFAEAGRRTHIRLSFAQRGKPSNACDGSRARSCRGCPDTPAATIRILRAYEAADFTRQQRAKIDADVIVVLCADGLDANWQSICRGTRWEHRTLGVAR